MHEAGPSKAIDEMSEKEWHAHVHARSKAMMDAVIRDNRAQQVLDA